MLKDEIWEVFTCTGNIEAYLYCKECLNTKEKNEKCELIDEKKVIEA